jgi:Zn finger protein HypA/HybF involved in hydrogenase expression
MRIGVVKLECSRCEHTWIPRKEEVVICPKCKSPYWHRKRQIKKGQGRRYK